MVGREDEPVEVALASISTGEGAAATKEAAAKTEAATPADFMMMFCM